MLKILFRNAFSRMYELLKPGGYLICSVLIKSEIYDAYCHVVTNEKYADYMHSLKQYLPPLYHDSDSVGTLATILKESGFKIKFLNDKKDVFEYETRLNYKSKQMIFF